MQLEVAARAEGPQGLLATAGSWKRRGGPVHSRLQRQRGPADALGLDSRLQNCDMINSCEVALFVVLCYDSPTTMLTGLENTLSFVTPFP